MPTVEKKKKGGVGGGRHSALREGWDGRRQRVRGGKRAGCFIDRFTCCFVIKPSVPAAGVLNSVAARAV